MDNEQSLQSNANVDRLTAAHGKPVCVHRSEARKPEIIIGQLALYVLNTTWGTRNTNHLYIISLPTVTQSLVSLAVSTFSKISEDLQWAFVGDDGTVYVHSQSLTLGNAVEQKISQRKTTRTANGTSTRGRNAFSPTNQWILRSVFMAGQPACFWAGTTTSPQTAAEIATQLTLSTPQAHRFLALFRETGHIFSHDSGFILSQRVDLMRRWFDARQSMNIPITPVQWSLGPGAAPQEVFARKDNSKPVVIGGFAACEHHGFLHVSDVPPPMIHIQKGELSATLDDFLLEPCTKRDADFILVETKKHERVWDSSVKGVEELPVVDALQAALDVCVDPRRGREQAEYVVQALGLLGET